jgi:hypothetical protein
MALKHLHLDRHLAASPILPGQSAKFNYSSRYEYNGRFFLK